MRSLNIACYYSWRGYVKRNWMRHAYVKRVGVLVTKSIENIRKREPLFSSVAFKVQVLNHDSR